MTDEIGYPTVVCDDGSIVREVRRILGLTREELLCEVSKLAANWLLEHGQDLDDDSGTIESCYLAAMRDASEVERCARAHGDAARRYDRACRPGGAAELRRVENLLWALVRGQTWSVVMPDPIQGNPTCVQFRADDAEIVRREDLERAASDPVFAGRDGQRLARAALAGDREALLEIHSIIGLSIPGVTEHGEGEPVRLVSRDGRWVFETGCIATMVDAAELVAWIYSPDGRSTLERRGILADPIRREIKESAATEPQPIGQDHPMDMNDEILDGIENDARAGGGVRLSSVTALQLVGMARRSGASVNTIKDGDEVK